MANYKIYESAEFGREAISTYDDLTNHHPSEHFSNPRRQYGTVDGKKEEIIDEKGERMVSKDFVLYDSTQAARPTDVTDAMKKVPVPAPIEGKVVVNEAQGKVEIYNPSTGEFLARIRHMSGIKLETGDLVSYGQPMGTQDKVAAPHVHVHMDFNSEHLDQLKKYIKDIDSGVISPNKYPSKTPEMRYNGSQLEPVSSQSSIVPKTNDQSYKEIVITKATAAVNDLCNEKGYPNHGGRDNMACHLAGELITQGSQGIGKFEAALGVDGKTISVREQISEFNSYTATADSNAIVNIPKADSLAKIAAYEAPVLAQNNPTHEQEISRGRSL